jgi:hypothetical protein
MKYVVASNQLAWQKYLQNTDISHMMIYDVISAICLDKKSNFERTRSDYTWITLGLILHQLPSLTIKNKSSICKRIRYLEEKNILLTLRRGNKKYFKLSRWASKNLAIPKKKEKPSDKKLSTETISLEQPLPTSNRCCGENNKAIIYKPPKKKSGGKTEERASAATHQGAGEERAESVSEIDIFEQLNIDTSLTRSRTAPESPRSNSGAYATWKNKTVLDEFKVGNVSVNVTKFQYVEGTNIEVIMEGPQKEIINLIKEPDGQTNIARTQLDKSSFKNFFRSVTIPTIEQFAGYKYSVMQRLKSIEAGMSHIRLQQYGQQASYRKAS